MSVVIFRQREILGWTESLASLQELLDQSSPAWYVASVGKRNIKSYNIGLKYLGYEFVKELCTSPLFGINQTKYIVMMTQ